jgi:hypothetical protein
MPAAHLLQLGNERHPFVQQQFQLHPHTGRE